MGWCIWTNRICPGHSGRSTGYFGSACWYWTKNHMPLKFGKTLDMERWRNAKMT